MLLRISGDLQEDGRHTWLSVNKHVALQVVKCTPKSGKGNYIVYVNFDNDINSFIFSDEEEFTWFQTLRNIKGVGNTKASRILSLFSSGELKTMVKNGDATAFASLPGIGQRTAKRIMVELGCSLDTLSDGEDSFMKELLEACAELGYDARNVQALLKEDPSWRTMSFEEALRWSIDKLNKED